MKALAEYIWLDGATPTQELRSKTRVVEITDRVHVLLARSEKHSS